jgi:hypothetical protein
MADRDTGTAGQAGAGPGKVREAARSTLESAKQEASGLAGQAAEKGKSVLAQQKDTAIEKLDSVAQALQGTAKQLEGDQTPGSRYVGMAADRLQRLGQTLRDKNVDDLIVDAREVARRAPGTFFAGSVVAGFLLSRFLKASSRQPAGSMYGDDDLDIRSGMGSSAGMGSGTGMDSSMGGSSMGSSSMGSSSMGSSSMGSSSTGSSTGTGMGATGSTMGIGTTGGASTGAPAYRDDGTAWSAESGDLRTADPRPGTSTGTGAAGTTGTTSGLGTGGSTRTTVEPSGTGGTTARVEPKDKDSTSRSTSLGSGSGSAGSTGLGSSGSGAPGGGHGH